jgi:hypothetical protein
MPFFLIKCEPFLLKIEKELNIDDYKSKSTWNWEISFENAFDFENYEFWKMCL